MFNFYSTKSRKTISTVIIVVVILSMVLSVFLPMIT